jgi:dihydrolipoamide dehydrogenase
VTFGDAEAEPRRSRWGRCHTRKDKIVNGLTKGIEFLFKKNKIAWIKGTARLAGRGAVEIVDGDKQTLPGGRDHRRHGVDAAQACPESRSTASGSSRSDEAHPPEERAQVARRSWAAAPSAWSSRRSTGASAATSPSSSCCRVSVPVEDEAVSAELEKSFKKQGIKVFTGNEGHESQSDQCWVWSSRRRRQDGATQGHQRRDPPRAQRDERR